MRGAAVAWHVVKRLPRPLLLASAAGWLLVGFQESVPSLPSLCLSRPTLAGAAMAGITATFANAYPLMLLLSWLVMMLAMTPPLLGGPSLHVWRRSLPRRRLRALALFLLGYLSIWLAAGIPLVGGAMVLSGLPSASGAAPFGVALAAACMWQATPYKQMSLNRCHSRATLAGFGLRAEVDAFRFGAQHGYWCACACWALMLPPLLAPAGLHWPTMAAVSLWAVAERARAPAPARWLAAWPSLPNSPARLAVERLAP